MRVTRILLVFSLLIAAASSASAQPLGTFRWQTAPFCNVVTLTVVQNGSVFTLDGFDQPCGGAPRMPVHGVAVVQANGVVTLGLTIVNPPAGPLVSLDAAVNLATLGGTWRDNAGNSGAFLFSPAAVSGGSRPAPVPSSSIPGTFALRTDGGFLAVGTFGLGDIPTQGGGTRLMWHPRKAAFRAGQVTNNNWDEGAVGQHSVAFGSNNVANGQASFAAGIESGASGTASVAIGSFSVAGADNAVAIGDNLTALGVGSVVLGTSAGSTVAGRGSFVFGDRSTANSVRAELPNQFVVRAVGGVFLTTSGAGNGCTVLPGSGGMTCTGAVQGGSDRTRKQDIVALDGDEVLRKVAALPVTTWSFVETPDVRHAGPMAQDFRAAFGLGDSETSIGYTDINGINMRAIQALEARTRATDERNRVLEEELRVLRAQMNAVLEAAAALAPRQR